MKNKFLILATLLFTSLAFSGPYDTWSNYRAVTVNTTTAAVTGIVTNFPLLVRLTNADAAHGSDVLAASATGDDIRFTDATGATSLSYQIEQWSATSAAIWVKVPSIAGSSTTDIRMYWGKSGQTSLSSGPAVFDTANGFGTVFHMNSGTTGNETDATANAFSAAAAGAPLDTAGIVGRSRSFNGSSQYFLLANSATGALDFRPTSNYSLSTWFYNNSPAVNSPMIDKGDNNWSMGVTSSPFYFEFQGARGYTCNSGTSATAGYCVDNTHTPTANGGVNILASQAELLSSWHHIAGTFTGGSGTYTGSAAIVESLYIDGVLVGVATSTAITGNPVYNFGVTIGARVAGTAPGTTFDRYWNGRLDEIEVSTKVRSRDWVKLSYATQTAVQTAVTLGASTSTGPVTPGAPTAVTGGAGNAQVTVSWTAPTTGTAVVSYTATSSPGSFTCTTAATSCIVTGLTNGTGYTFSVTATNTAGTSPASAASAIVTPSAPVGAPNVVASASATAGTGQATISWTAPSAGVPATGYTVTASQDTSKHCSTTSISTVTCNVTGLTNGLSYTFSVVATNASGAGPALTTNAVTPTGAPQPPTAVLGAAGNAQVTVTFTAPTNNGGSAVILYTVTAAPGGATCAATSPTSGCAVTGLTNGTGYTFTVTATNSLGTSVASAASATITPATVPGAPGTPTAAGGTSGQITVSWAAPSTTGGSAILSYKAFVVSDTTKSCTTTGLTCAVTGLTNTTSYTFQVKAINAMGAGTVSATSNAATGIFSFTRDLGLHMTASSMSLRLPEFSGSAQISVTDLWGRTVWSKTVNAGVRDVSWGRASSGLVPGLYILRLTLQDGSHKARLAAETKIMLTP